MKERYIQYLFNETYNVEKLYTDTLKEMKLENETVKIQPNGSEFWGDMEFLSEHVAEENLPKFDETHLYIDKNIYYKTFDYLLEKDTTLEKNVDDICYIIKRAYVDWANINISFFQDLKSLYKNLENETTQIKFIGDKKGTNFLLKNERIIKYVKLLLSEGILANAIGLDALLDDFTGARLKKPNNVFSEVIYNLCHYFIKNNLASQRIGFEYIYDILKNIEFLSSKLPNEKLDEDKYRYIHKTNNDYKKKNKSKLFLSSELDLEDGFQWHYSFEPILDRTLVLNSIQIKQNVETRINEIINKIKTQDADFQ